MGFVVATRGVSIRTTPINTTSSLVGPVEVVMIHAPVYTPLLAMCVGAECGVKYSQHFRRMEYCVVYSIRRSPHLLLYVLQKNIFLMY